MRVADFGLYSEYQGMDNNFALLGFDFDDHFIGDGQDGGQNGE